MVERFSPSRATILAMRNKQEQKKRQYKNIQAFGRRRTVDYNICMRMDRVIDKEELVSENVE